MANHVSSSNRSSTPASGRVSRMKWESNQLGTDCKFLVIAISTSSSPEPTHAGGPGFGKRRASKYRDTESLEQRNTSQYVPLLVVGPGF